MSIVNTSLLKGVVNYASSTNNAQLIYCSSETIGFPSEHLLIDDDKNQLWISESKLPQTLVIKIDQNIERQKNVCLAGWFCHKKYIFNPRVVKLYVAKTYDPEKNALDINHDFIHWATMTAEDLIGTHFFKLRPIPNDYCYFKFEFIETFGGTRLYMNKLYILKDYPDFSNNQSREDYMLKTPQYNVDLNTIPNTTVNGGSGGGGASKVTEQSTKKLAVAKQLFTGNESIMSETGTPTAVKSRVRLDRRYREAEDAVQRSINRDWIRSRPNLMAPSPAPSLLFDHNYSMMSSNEISASPLVSMSFYGKPNESFSNRLPPRTATKADQHHHFLHARQHPASHPPNTANANNTHPSESNTSAHKVNDTIKPQSPAKEKSTSSKQREPPIDNKAIEIREAKSNAQSTVADIRELEAKLENLSATIQTRKQANSSQVIVPPTVDPAGINEQQFASLMDGIGECLLKTRDIQAQVNQLSDRIRVLESNPTGPVLGGAGNVGLELKRDLDGYKESFDERMSQKLRKTMEKVEEKLNKAMEAHVLRLFEERTKVFQRDINTQIAETLSRVKLVHPDNKKIEEYNTKIKFINKKVVTDNKNSTTKEQAYLQQQFYPSTVQQSATDYVKIADPITTGATTAASKSTSRTTTRSASASTTARYIRNLKEHMDDRSKRLDRLDRAMKSSKPAL